MKPSKQTLARTEDPSSPQRKWMSRNYVYFPQELRDAIPGPELPGCDRCLILSGIDGASGVSWDSAKRVRLKLRVEESGTLTGSFDVVADLNVEAARALAATLRELVEQSES